MDARCCHRVHACQLCVQAGPTDLLSFGGDGCTHGLVGLGQLRQTFQQRTKVQPRAAGQNRQPAARHDLRDRLACIGGELRCRIHLPGIAQVEQMMRNRRTHRRIRLGCADFQAAVHQRRIDADDFSIPALCSLKRQRRLAAGSGAHHGDRQRALVDSHQSSSGQRIAGVAGALTRGTGTVS